MGGSRTQVNKAHKSRFASKASRQVHMTSLTDKARIAMLDHRNAAKGARAARLQRNKTVRDQKRAALLKEKRGTSGVSSPPRIIVLCGLSSSVNLNSLVKDLLMLLSGEENEATSATIASPIYKLRVTVLVAPHGDLLSCMEMAKVADLIAFVVSANSLYDGCESSNLIDSFGTQALFVFRAVGLPSTAVMIRDLPVDIRRKQELKKMSVSCLASELPEDCRFYQADTKEELHKFMWLFKEQHLSVPHWRNQRSYVMSQEVGYEPDGDNPGTCTLLLSGYVRAHSLSVNQLVHVSGAGDFQLGRIDFLKDPVPMNERPRIWDCNSSLYDSFELISIKRHLDSAISINNSSSIRCLSMPRLSDTDPDPNQLTSQATKKKKISSSISTSVRKFIRILLFRPNASTAGNNKHLRADGGGLATDDLPAMKGVDFRTEFEFDIHFGSAALRKTVSERFTRSVGAFRL